MRAERRERAEPAGTASSTSAVAGGIASGRSQEAGAPSGVSVVSASAQVRPGPGAGGRRGEAWSEALKASAAGA